MEYRRIEIEPISGALGAEVRRVDLAKLDDETFAEIHRAWLDHLVLFFRDQELSVEDQAAFAERIGPLFVHPYLVPVEGHASVIEIVKQPEDKSNFGGTWHSDISYVEQPTLGAMLYALEVPEIGGDTLFANMYLAYEGLSPGLRRLLAGLGAVHNDRATGYYDRDRVGAMAVLQSADDKHGAEGPSWFSHPAVRTHPETGRDLLFINEAVTIHFEGMTEAESRPLLDYLFRHYQRPEFTCRFRWTPGAVALWDNRCTQHKAIDDYTGQRRHMRRVLIAGDRPYSRQAAAE